MLSSIVVHTKPPLPPDAHLHYSELKQMALDFDATETLCNSDMLDVGNVRNLSLNHNVIILRPGTGTKSPPDCELKVQFISDAKYDR